MRIEVEPGFSLNVERSGAGPAVVLLHGFTGSARAWSPFGERLAERHTVLAVDIVGHGESDKPAALEHYGMERAAGDIVAAVEKLGFARAMWLGYSMGGRLALNLAVLHPERVERLVLIGASPGLAEAEERRARVASDEALARGIERDGVERFIDYWESIPLFASQKSLPAERRAGIRSARLANTAVGLASSLRGMGTGSQAALHSRLKELTMPALLLAGELDAKYLAIGQEMAAEMPESRFVAVPGAGHAAQTEQPEFCANEVVAFLAGTKAKEGVTR
jgi:2-succinyl-6-hydroxy-2,4-cyclohexadiene-1-carboxylate synthase